MTETATGKRVRGRLAKRTSKLPTGNGGLSMRQAPVDKIMRAKVAALTAYAKNPRLHSPEQVQTIANSMREFGQTQLVVVDERGEIICGHGRILAAELLGWTHVMVGVAVGWTDAEKRACRISDNQTGLTSTWDFGLLGSELTDLQTGEFDLSLLGFDESALFELMADKPVEGADPEAVPDPPKVPVVKRGDLWLLGGYYQCACGVKNDLQELRYDICAETFQSENVFRQMQEDAPEPREGQIQGLAQGLAGRETVEKKSGKGPDRPRLPSDRKGKTKSGAAGDTTSAAALLQDEEATQSNSTLSSLESPTNRGKQALRAVRRDGGFNDGSRAVVEARGQARAIKSSGPLSVMQCEQGASDSPICKACGSALSVTQHKGGHRLYCGDATNADDVARVLGGETPHLMVTDPPYGVEYDPAWRNKAAAEGHLAYALRRVGKVASDDRVDWKAAWELFAGDVAYCWHADRHASSVQQTLEITGLVIRCQIIWAKSNYPISRGNYHWRHEPCWYAVRNGATAHWQGARDQTTVWQINLDRNVDGGHSTQKPIDCMKRPIENNSKSGDGVYDPFVGSGTTIIAAEMTARRCFAIDVDPVYAEVAMRRWEQFTGKTAVLDKRKAPPKRGVSQSVVVEAQAAK